MENYYLSGIKFLFILITGLYIIFMDLKKQIIPNKINCFLLIFGFLLAFIEPEQLLSKLTGCLIIGLLMLFLAVVFNGFGLGDTKYMFNIGWILGLNQGIDALFIGLIIGGCVSVMLLVYKKVTLKDRIPFAPYLVMGALASFLV